MEKLAYEKCDYCGVMVEEDADPEAYQYQEGEVVCLYCREAQHEADKLL